jgi:hypothetical protein
MNRTISLAALTVLKRWPADQISVAGAAGYDFLGLRLIPATAVVEAQVGDALASRAASGKLMEAVDF